jgi:hypothetical protein
MSPDCSIPGMAASTLSLLPNKQYHPGHLYASTAILQPPGTLFMLLVADIRRRSSRIAAASGSNLRMSENPPVLLQT